MNLYVYKFHGVWLSGSAVIAAESEEAAHAMFTEENLGEWENIRLEKAIPLSSLSTTRVIQFDNGDY